MNKLLHNLEPSSTLQLNQLAKSMVAQGKSVINLTAGEPDFNTPDRIMEAAYKAMKEGKTKYTHTAGIPELRTAIAQYINHTYNRDYSIEEIVVTNGGKQAIFNFCFSLLNAGDEVIIPAPYWVSYKSIVEMVGAVPVVVASGIEKNFEPDLSAIESKINSKTKVLIINSPNNPSGAIFSSKFFQQLEAMLIRHPNLMVVTDDIYEKFVYDNQSFYSIGMSSKITKDRLVIIGGVSKTYSMTGWRIGYAVGPKSLISVMSNVQSQTTSNASSISQWGALEALVGATDTEIGSFLTLFQKRRDLAYQTLANVTGVECAKPNGAFYIFPKIDQFLNKTSPAGKKIVTDDDLSYYLLEEYGVASVPGGAFGMPGYIRLSFVVSQETWNEGVRRLEIGLKQLK